MKAASIVLALALAFAATAHADPLPLKGAYAFDIMSPKKSKSAKVDGALLAKLNKSYVCTPPADPKSSASGKPIVSTCEIKKGKPITFILMATLKDCKEERETQLANGGD